MVGSEQMDNKGFFNLLSRYKFVLSMENAICPVGSNLEKSAVFNNQANL